MSNRLSLLALASTFSLQVFAQLPGSLDNTFSTDGIVTANIYSNDFANSIVVQPDGKILVAGYSDLVFADSIDFTLIRFNTNGTLDNAFGVGGKVTTDFNSGDDIASCMVLQADGKIVIAGSTWNGIALKMAIARYNSNGQLDNTFGINGKVLSDTSLNEQDAVSIAIQTDGKIVATGAIKNGSYYDLMVARYNSDGTIDGSFGINGEISTDLAPRDDGGISVAIQPNGKIIVAGIASFDDTTFHAALVRYNENGTLDNSFNSDGKLITDFGTSRDLALFVAPLSNGKIIVAGNSYTEWGADFAVARFNEDGTIDGTFGNDGKVTTNVSIVNGLARAAALQQDGKIIVVGFAGDNLSSNTDLALVRYYPDGSLDSSFGTDGKVITAVGSGRDEANSVSIANDGKIVVAGITDMDPSIYYLKWDVAVARYISGLNVGIIDFTADDNSALIYPNPIDQTATLKYTLKDDAVISIQLANMQGEILKTFIENQNQQAGERRQEIVLPEELPSGSYFIIISSLKGKVSVEIVK